MRTLDASLEDQIIKHKHFSSIPNIQMKKLGDVLRALGQNPTESEVKRLVQSTCQVNNCKKHA